MSKRWTRWLVVGILGLNATVLAGCASTGDDAPDDGANQESGRIQLALVTADTGSYRLSQARFEITNQSGALTATLDSESDPAATALIADLPQAAYSVDLREGWVLERREGETFVPVRAALITPNPVEVRVRHGRLSTLVFTFATEDGEVSFGEGSLSVGVDVVPVGALSSCNLLDPASCGAGQTCLLADGEGTTFCGDAGALPVGAACSGEQCVAGAQCLALDPANPSGSTCARFCNPAAPPFGCDCRSLSFAEDVGVCTPSNVPEVSYAHTFIQGSWTSVDSCREWHDFRNQLSAASGTYGSVSLAGSLDPSGQWCDDPAAATQICNGLAAGVRTSVSCNGHVWNVGFCGSELMDGSLTSAVELSVDDEPCMCGQYSVRPCMEAGLGGSQAWGGVGASACSAMGQDIEVACALIQ